MTPVRINRAKITILVCLLFAAYFVYTAASSTLRSQALRNEYGESTREIAELQQKQEYLEGVLNYVGSDAYVEQEARRKLGYIREGEVPFVVTSPPLEEPTQDSGEWWERLFPR